MKSSPKNLEGFIKESLEALEHVDQYERLLQQVNARIDADAHFLLGKLAERFHTSRAAMAGSLLENAIRDAWHLADMPTVELGKGSKLPAIYSGGELYDDYRAYMHKLGVTVDGYKPAPESVK